jgi:pimeloyl-ACP methyl ester carboxylesterase
MKETEKNQKQQTHRKDDKTYVFIPGAWHGGWVYDVITEKLELVGKKCLPLTLPGLEEKSAVPSEIINLDSHIQSVINTIINNNLTEVILCGHSYAGLVITGVADQIPERIYALVYIDAYIPKSGDSCWSLTSDVYRQRFVDGARNNGFTVADRPGVDDRRRPHPLAAFMQSLKLTGSYKRIFNRTFIYLSGWVDSPFVQQYEDLKDSPHWHIETIHCGHNVMSECPDKLVDILFRLENTYSQFIQV